MNNKRYIILNKYSTQFGGHTNNNETTSSANSDVDNDLKLLKKIENSENSENSEQNSSNTNTLKLLDYQEPHADKIINILENTDYFDIIVKTVKLNLKKM